MTYFMAIAFVLSHSIISLREEETWVRLGKYLTVDVSPEQSLVLFIEYVAVNNSANDTQREPICEPLCPTLNGKATKCDFSTWNDNSSRPASLADRVRHWVGVRVLYPSICCDKGNKRSWCLATVYNIDGKAYNFFGINNWHNDGHSQVSPKLTLVGINGDIDRSFCLVQRVLDQNNSPSAYSNSDDTENCHNPLSRAILETDKPRSPMPPLWFLALFFGVLGGIPACIAVAFVLVATSRSQ